jgi:hypothetical protein
VQQTLSHGDGNGLKVLGNLRIASSNTVLMYRLKDIILSVGFTAFAIFVGLGLLLWAMARSLIVKPLVTFSDKVGSLIVNGQGMGSCHRADKLSGKLAFQ